MAPVDFVSLSLFAGIAVLLTALAPILRLLNFTRSRQLRLAWILLTILILGFAAGYFFLIFAIPRTIDPILLAVISGIMIMGAVFVLSVAYLSEQTATDVARLAELERDVIVDPLTGIHNRRYFNERFKEEEARSIRTGRPLSLLLTDLDHFKSINDTYGHAAGDHVLSVTAARLSDVVRGSDILARFGGEEFVVLAPHTDGHEAVRLAERLRMAISSTSVTVPSIGQIHITASIGVAMYQVREGREALFARADAALYEAKTDGRNRVLFKEQTPQARVK